MNINWYPGHMAKTRRLMAEQLKAVDMVIEVVDARIPLASRNPDFDGIFGEKARMIALNKADLADPAQTKAWVKHYEALGWSAMETCATGARDRAKILSAMDAVTRPAVEKMLQKRGVKKTVRAMIAGIPNVGKSALINSLSQGAAARVGNRPGVTRGSQLIRVTPYLELMDTPGVLWPKLEVEEYARHLAFTGAIKDEVTDGYGLALLLLGELKALCPRALEARYAIEWTEDPQENLQAIARARGLLLKGGVPDEERSAALVIREFREGKLGRVTLEAAP